MSEQTANLCTTDACESLRARLAKYEDDHGNPKLPTSNVVPHGFWVCTGPGSDGGISVNVGASHGQSFIVAHGVMADFFMAIENAQKLSEVSRLSKYEDAEGNPISTIAEQAREIERLKADYNDACGDAMTVARELAALKAQSGGVVLPNEAHLWPLEVGVEAQQRAADAGCDRIDCLHDGLQAMLSEVARLNSSPASAGDDDDQAYDAEAERLTAEALGTGAGINPNATSIDDIFLTVCAGEVDERAAFEARFSKVYDLDFDEETEEYKDPGDQALWYGWQARAALSAPSHGEQVREWVPVSERLPDETHAYGCHTGDVLCRTRSGRVIVALLARTTTGDVWYDQQSKERDVTHWMPLPAAPSVGSQEQGE